MRLLTDEISTIKEVLAKYSSTGITYLHGSRIDDAKKGGDIDLFFIVENDELEQLKKIKYNIQAELSLNLREQKVDLIILSQNESSQDQFFINSFKVRL